MRILGIETSCDETAAAVAEARGEKIRILSDVVSSQIEIHKKYGGVIPEVAAREHVLNVLPVIGEALKGAGIRRESAPKRLDAIAVTAGPGLITSLIVGAETARALAYAWKLPLVPVNHIEGHIYANSIEAGLIKFPAMVLTVSGGHNLLVLMRGHGQYKVIGDTLDDAAGEAFDKAAAMLGLGYPGGPIISTEASKFAGAPAIGLPRPMLNSKDFNFSFSGLKTALLYKLKQDRSWRRRVPEYAAEFQQAAIDVLIFKTLKAAEKFKARTVMLSGGVSANKELRTRLERQIKEKLKSVEFRMPDLKYTTDNAAMIAAAGYFRAKAGKLVAPEKLRLDPNLKL